MPLQVRTAPSKSISRNNYHRTLIRSIRRLWVRNFFNELTGAGKGTDKTLKHLRMEEKGEKSGNIEEYRRSEEVALRSTLR